MEELTTVDNKGIMARKQLRSVKNIWGVTTLNLTAMGVLFETNIVRRELGWIPVP